MVCEFTLSTLASFRGSPKSMEGVECGEGFHESKAGGAERLDIVQTSRSSTGSFPRGKEDGFEEDGSKEETSR